MALTRVHWREAAMVDRYSDMMDLGDDLRAERSGVRASSGGRSDIRRIMRDEVARSEIRRALGHRRRFLTHPIMLGLYATVLAYLVLSSIAFGLLERAQAQQLRSEALEAVREFSTMASERTERMALLSSSLARNADFAEIDDRKARYDDSAVKWNSNLQKNYLYFREAFGYTFKTFAEYAIDNSLSQLFQIYELCLIQSYDRRADEISAGAGLSVDRCLERSGIIPAAGESPSAAMERRLRTCRDEIYGVLNHFVMKDIHCGAEKTWRPREQPNGALEPPVVALTYQSLMRLCEMENPPPLEPISDAEHEIFCTRASEDALLSRFGLDFLAERFAQ